MLKYRAKRFADAVLTFIMLGVTGVLVLLGSGVAIIAVMQVLNWMIAR